jgi:HD-GYP domain-containing protein (c-di-GMP phosphodiesterase class II)
LRGEEIPLAARILAVVDAFEALTVGRPYRDPVPDTEALAELRRAAGSQFDPTVVEALAALLDERAGSPRSAAAATPATGRAEGVSP